MTEDGTDTAAMSSNPSLSIKCRRLLIKVSQDMTLSVKWLHFNSQQSNALLAVIRKQ